MSKPDKIKIMTGIIDYDGNEVFIGILGNTKYLCATNEGGYNVTGIPILEIHDWLNKNIEKLGD